MIAIFRTEHVSSCLYFWRCITIAKEKDLPTNGDIRDKEIRVVSAEGEQLGIMTPKAAMDIAEREGLDLVKISPNANPPVCKIIDYGKYKFENAKRLKEAKKSQKIVEMKEIQLSCKIDVGDYNTKANHAIKFLKNGDKVKVTIRFRGREMAHVKLGEEVIRRFAETCSEFGTVEKEPKLEGRNIMLFMAPKKQS